MRRILPPFIAGAVAVLTAELTLSLLLFARPGFLRALTAILAIQLASLAVGFGVGPRRDAQGAWTVAAAVSLRWRWLFAVASLAVAAAAAAGWSLLGGLGGTALQRGVAVAALGALPLMTLGAVLGGVAQRTPSARVAVWAALGGAFGAALLGGVLLTRVLPVSMLVGSALFVSFAAILDGGIDRAEFDEGAAEDDAILSIDALAPEGVIEIERLAPDPERV
ncbi:MAG: hypothetical protein KJO11_05415 [Gemmatimonadetes bacterium]|nr:hypothetical protein [Gemmatimonadota bacterium]